MINKREIKIKGNQCECCKNIVEPTDGITFYWLQGKKFVYHVCWQCWNKKSRLNIFLRQKNDSINSTQGDK